MALSEKDKAAVGQAIGATAPEKKERRIVQVDLNTLGVYPETGHRTATRRIGTIISYTINDGARIRTSRGMSSPFVSRRLTVRFSGDPRRWVGQFKKDETETVILRPLPKKES